MTHSLRLILLITATICILCSCDDKESPVDDHAGHDHGTSTSAIEPDTHDDDDAHDDTDDHDTVAEEDARADDDHADEDDGEGIITLDDHELAEFGIHLETVQSGSLSHTVSLAGEVVLNPDRVAHVVSRAGGIGSEVLHTTGDYVQAGETLAILESPELAESKAEFLSRAAQAALATTDLARAETIHANTIRLLDIIAGNPDVDTLRKEIGGLDIGANRGSLISMYAELRSAEAIYSREGTLYDRKVSSESEFLNAESELQKALATFQAVRDDLAFANRRELDAARRSHLVAGVSHQAAERRLHALGLNKDEVSSVENEKDMQLARYEVRAPITGRIIERHLVRGESLEAGEQIFVISDLSSVWGQLTIYQRDLGVVQEGQTALVLGTHGLGRTIATIEYVNPILDEQTRTTTARVVLDNVDGHWRPGMFIRAELQTNTRDAHIVVPRSAIQVIDNETIVFVETTKGLERRHVNAGQNDTNFIEILSGLQLGERLVVSGGLALKAELNKAALEHAGHAH